MARGYTFKRCAHGITGTPARGSKPAVPACKVRHGSWGWRAEGPRDPDTGRRTQPSRSGFASRVDAEEALAAHLAEVAEGRGVFDRRLTVEQWLRKWLTIGRWSPATLERYSRDVETIVAQVGDVRLRDLSHYDVERMFEHLSRVRTSGRIAGRAPKASTVELTRRTLRSALTKAVRLGYLSHNVAAGDFDVLVGAGDTEPAWWQPDELERFLRFVADDELSSLWTVAAFTGLRRGELCGLRWSDVALGEGEAYLSINQRVISLPGEQDCSVCGLSHDGRVILPGAKTKSGRRRVPLSTQARVALLARRAEYDDWKQRWADVASDHDLVWPTPGGEPLPPNWLTKRHADLVAAAGVPTICLHEMRHGAVSILSAAGMPTDQIALVVGHSSSTVTRGVYIHGIWKTLAGHVQAGSDLVMPRSAQEVHGDAESREEKGA